jgi:hypothetical protein
VAATDLLFALPLAAHWVLAFAAVGLVSATAVAAAGCTRGAVRASLLALAGATWLAADAGAARMLSGGRTARPSGISVLSGYC